MSEQVPEQVIESQGTDSTQSTGGDSPWASYVNDLPDGIKALVEPKFKEWDANVTQRFQTVHSQYEPLKAYQPLVEAGLDYEEVDRAIQIAQILNNEPERVYQLLAQQYGNQVPAGEQGASDEEDDGLSYPLPPEFEEYKQMTAQMANIMAAQHQAQQQAKEDAELDQHIASLKASKGDFDEDYVLTKVYSNGGDWDAAIAAYQAIAAPKAPAGNAPVVMGAGGGLPANPVNPATMNDKERKALVAQMIANANSQ